MTLTLLSLAKTKGRVSLKNKGVGLRAAARELILRFSFFPIPLAARTGIPTVKGWPALRITADRVDEYFDHRAGGIGVILGIPGGKRPGTMDVDLDSPEARKLAPSLLPDTGMIFGRIGSPASHRFYGAAPCGQSMRFEDPRPGDNQRKTLVELRGLTRDGNAGYQTRVPPSIHKSGEQITFDRDDKPAIVNVAELQKAVARLAAGALLVRHWPESGGGRHSTMLALAGTLFTIGWAEEDAQRFAEAVYRALPDPDPKAIRRLRGEVHDTFTKRSTNKPATGVPTLKARLDARIVDVLLQWLGGNTDLESVSEADAILTSDLLSRAVEKAETLLVANPAYNLFARGSQLVHLVQEQEDFKEEAVFQRPNGNTYLAKADAAYLEFILSKARCVWHRDRNTGVLHPADPRLKWCEHIVGRLVSTPDLVPWLWLNAVTKVPLLLKDGSLVDKPGYHKGTRVWFDPQKQKFPDIPAQPTKREARKALELFASIFGEFPFATTKDQAWDASPSYSAVLATIFGVLLRHILPTVPMLGVTGPEAGSGKTKIAESIGAATTGHLLSRLSYDNTEEFDKQLPIPLAAGDQIVLIDNVERKIVNSARLSTALSTDAAIKWRILGETREQIIINWSVFIATGNQLIISGDLPRRSLLCRLVPNVAVPEARCFDFDPVTRARERFPELAMAALTAARYYLQAKCPTPQYAKGIAIESGSFTEWNHIVRGLLVHLGFGDPLATQQEVRNENPMLENDIELARALASLFPPGETFSARAIERLTGSDAYCLLLGSDQRWDAQKVGFRLRGLRDRPLEGLKVEVAGRMHGVALYRVERVK